MKPDAESLDLALSPMPAPSVPSPLAILDAAIKGGITADNVSVVKELIAMHREQQDREAKAAFAKAFFQLRKNMPEIYADKERTDLGGYAYCSEQEISKKLEPHLMAYGFAMLFGQTQSDGKITVNVTLMHEAGHSEVREYTVRTGRSNSAKDDTQADSGASTSAWRHLCIKLFGLKSRISENQDAKNLGAPISRDQAQILREMVKDTNADEAEFLRWCSATKYEDIPETRYAAAFAALYKKPRA